MSEVIDIIVVEDSRTQAEQLRHLLEANGYTVRVADHGEAALAEMQAHAPDLVITDIVMPGMDGYELCRKIKDAAATREVPVVLLTSLSDAGDVLSGLECGADNFITKPYDGQYLLSLLENLLLNRRLYKQEPARLCMEVHFRGQRHLIDADRMQVISLLLSSYENAVYVNQKLARSQQELARLNAELEERVQEGTRQLYQAQKMEAVGRLAAGVAHDFNNMLMVIRGFADMLGRETPAEDRRSHHIGEIRKAVDRASELTEQLLVFSRKDTPALEAIDLNEVLRDTTDMLERTIGGDVTLRTSYSPEALPVEADRGQLTQVLMNLAVNARDAITAGGRLEISTAAEATEGSAVLVVRDTGCGMDQHVLDHVFEPFFTTKEKGKGTGLGLSVVYGIITGIAGSISCDSSPGQGTTFTIRLPLTDRPVAQI
jgi:two-component system sensor histidine kinase/response regulator